jgi:hypothetical protein
MSFDFQKPVVWLTAFVAVAAFYAHTVFAIPSREVSPISAGSVAAGLIILAILGLVRGVPLIPTTNARWISAGCLVGALMMCTASTILAAEDRQLSVNDIGIFAVRVGLPILTFFCARRAELIIAIGRWCVLFAIGDTVANLAAYFEIYDFVQTNGHEGGAYGVHYLGLCGNTFAEGMVGFIAITFLAMRRPGQGPILLVARLALIATLLVSLWLGGSRVYISMTIVALGLLWVKHARLAPLALVALGLGASYIVATFNAPFDDFEEMHRSWLMQAGWADVMQHPWLGVGAFYRDQSNLTSNFIVLRQLGVTESGAIDFVNQFGVVSAGLMLSSWLLALSVRAPK